MSSEITWSTLESAVTKYCLETSVILKWVEEGSVCADQPDTRAMRINIDDLERRVQFEKKSTQDFRDCD